MSQIDWAQIWTRLKREDPVLVSARQSLEIDLDWKGRLEGMELWTLWELGWTGAGGTPTFLLQETTALANPNRERAWILHDRNGSNLRNGRNGVNRASEPARTELGPPGQREGEWFWCVVWDRESPRPHHAYRVCERLLSHRSMLIEELVRAHVWGFRWSEAIPDPAEATTRAAVTRTRKEGLLVNPHVQSHEVFCGSVPRPWWTKHRGVPQGGPL